MGLFNLFSSKSKTDRKVQQAINEYIIHDGVANIMPDDPEEYLEKGYSGNTTVYSIINRVVNMTKQAELKLYQKDATGKKTEITQHDLLKFKKKVNSHTTLDDFIDANLIYLMTIGENFIYAPRLSSGIDKGKVIELHALPAADVEIIEGSIFDPVKGYRLEGNYKSTFEPSEVHHVKLINPNYRQERSLHGLSPLRAAARTVSKLNESEVTQLKQLQNQGVPYILTREQIVGQTTQRLSPEQQMELMQKIKNASKENHRGLPLILPDKFSKLDLGNKLADLELIQSSAAGIIALCAVYGLPPELFGYGQKTYNNMATARKSAWTDCIMPTLDKVEDMLNAVTIFGSSYEDQGFEWGFDYSDVEELQEGYQTQVDWMSKAYWSPNEIRQATGKEKIDDPIMDQPMIPLGSTPLSDFGIDLTTPVKSFEDYKNKNK